MEKFKRIISFLKTEAKFHILMICLIILLMLLTFLGEHSLLGILITGSSTGYYIAYLIFICFDA